MCLSHYFLPPLSDHPAPRPQPASAERAHPGTVPSRGSPGPLGRRGHHQGLPEPRPLRQSDPALVGAPAAPHRALQWGAGSASGPGGDTASRTAGPWPPRARHVPPEGREGEGGIMIRRTGMGGVWMSVVGVSWESVCVLVGRKAADVFIDGKLVVDWLLSVWPPNGGFSSVELKFNVA